MLVLTGKALLLCSHGGVVAMKARQEWVRIGAVPVLVDDDPRGRTIAACPMLTPTTPPCRHTTGVDDRSYSKFVAIDGRRLCLDTTAGSTDWSQGATGRYSVAKPGQDIVTCGA
ncbi:hypothetical protein [Aureimonas leprariae]|uniref:Uncharacterized protein n=1 Tax=Plantimonas leprariae TaxID=2615207 RepID=A0A7V7TXS9_9HYPH|nr:hypothetical protein [Aureimonas leprariae]KAB0681336.1 hypothetical protein F6X38_05475 [Aureimonas leprariae]